MIPVSKESNTLFLDRDGVINKRPLGDYVKKWDDFEFLQGVHSAIQKLSLRFKRIIVITNQQGIGKELMSMNDLEDIHLKMINEIEVNGGRIDAIYYCPELASQQENCRKPGIKMAKKAKADFPEIRFEQSIMVGDTESDMEFGKNAGMETVLIGNTNDFINKNLVDHKFSSLFDFANAISAND